MAWRSVFRALAFGTALSVWAVSLGAQPDSSFRKPEAGSPAAGASAAPQGPGESSAAGGASRSAAPLVPSGALDAGASSTRVSRGNGVLPHDHGQQWREYDIRPYTSRIATTARPEQAVIDWILRETGTEIWFSEPLGLLSADRDTLRVYHTPEMQQLVSEIVNRFVSCQTEPHAFGLHLVTVGSPNWRSRALPLMRSVTVQSPGVDAWLLSRENAAVLIGELRKRADFRERNSPNLLIQNGQSHTISNLQPRHYVRSVKLRENTFPGYELEMGQIQEGFSLQISPLLALDGTTVDAVIKCQIDQVEKLVPVAMEVPTASAARQSVQIQVPQLVAWRLHERFRWPIEEVLLLSCGVVATPSPERPAPLGIPNLLAMGPSRADALLFVESKGTASQALFSPQSTAAGNSATYRGRY